MQVSELDKSIDVSGLTSVEDCVFIIWNWEWRDGEKNNSSNEDSRTDITVIPETPPSPSDNSDQADNDALLEAAASISCHQCYSNCDSHSDFSSALAVQKNCATWRSVVPEGEMFLVGLSQNQITQLTLRQ